MALFDFLRRKGQLSGAVVLHDVPEYISLAAWVHFCRVQDASSKLPYDGNPPGSACSDGVQVRGIGDPPDKPMTFCVVRPAGFYYCQVAAIACRKVDGKVIAQVEQQFPVAHPFQVLSGRETKVELSLRWSPLEKLHYYGTVHPEPTRCDHCKQELERDPADPLTHCYHCGQLLRPHDG